MIDIAILTKLDAPTKEERLSNLREIIKTAQFPPMVPQYINNHIHTTYSFSPYSPTAAVFAARMEGLCTAGIIDHDSISGAREFLEAAKIIGMTVQNILDMTRISGGKLMIHQEYEAVDDLVSQVIQRVPYLVKSGRLHVKMPDEIVLLYVDGRMFDQALLNILDNAYKHSGENSHGPRPLSSEPEPPKWWF